MSKLRQGVKGLLLMGCAGSVLKWATAPSVMVLARQMHKEHRVRSAEFIGWDMYFDVGTAVFIVAVGVALALLAAWAVWLCAVDLGKWYEAKT